MLSTFIGWPFVHSLNLGVMSRLPKPSQPPWVSERVRCISSTTKASQCTISSINLNPPNFTLTPKVYFIILKIKRSPIYRLHRTTSNRHRRVDKDLPMRPDGVSSLFCNRTPKLVKLSRFEWRRDFIVHPFLLNHHHINVRICFCLKSSSHSFE